MEPLYKGQVGDGSFVPYTVEPLYKGQVGDGSFVSYTVEPLYKLRMGPLSLIQWSLSTRDKLRMGPLSLIQWSLSTRDKLGTGPLSLIQWSLGDGPYTVELLYKGQVGDGSFVPYTVEPLYKGHSIRDESFVPCREIVLRGVPLAECTNGLQYKIQFILQPRTPLGERGGVLPNGRRDLHGVVGTLVVDIVKPQLQQTLPLILLMQVLSCSPLSNSITITS